MNKEVIKTKNGQRVILASTGQFAYRNRRVVKMDRDWCLLPINGKGCEARFRNRWTGVEYIDKLDNVA